MRFSLATAAILAGQALASPPQTPPGQAKKQTLDAYAKRSGLEWFGTAVDIPNTTETTDAAYLSVLGREFGEMTPANALKFLFTEQGPNSYSFTDGDYFMKLADRLGKATRCHNLVWATQVSDWVLNGNWTAETLTEVMRNHIHTVVKHFGTRCHSWDVVNEAFNGDGTFSSSIWHDTIGDEYIYLAFQFAEEALAQVPGGHKVGLYYNDYGIESPGTKVDAVLAFVKELRARGHRITGVGLESHFMPGDGTPSQADQIATKKAYIKAGLDVIITELDVRFGEEPFYTAEVQKAQALSYYNTVASCVKTAPGCKGVIVWDFDDEYSWVPYSFEGQGGATLYNDTLQAKPAYYAVADALQGKPCSVC